MTSVRWLCAVLFAGVLVSCSTAPGKCTAANCANGCCDNTGACHVSAATTCGIAGATCTSCMAGQQCDGSGVCSFVHFDGGGTANGGGSAGGGNAVGGGSAVDAGCSSDSMCGVGLGCRPISAKCEARCSGSSDCVASAKTCAPINSSTSNFCQCTSDVLCGGGLVCGVVTKSCIPPCSMNAECPAGLECQVSTGQCLVHVADAGTADAGVADAGTSCTDTNQPGTCAYGSFCSGTACASVAAPTCANFGSASPPVFNPLTSTGPIIYGYVDEANDDTTFCGQGYYVYSLTFLAYRTDAYWVPGLTNLPSLIFVNSQGDHSVGVGYVRSTGYVVNSANPRMASVKLTFCSTTVTSNFRAGLYFAGGNEFCAVATAGAHAP